ncbi:unnamed protein product [marine sediment metagenome]|uniref:Uncharacterized protein n=1 Tax=marine sediment metagenome TaxID=412755 RepID=X1QGD2_9ZZZZ
MEQPKQEVCQIRIMFPVNNDEEAIAYKKKITALLSEIPEAQIQFSLTNMPPMPNVK